jgi:uridine kinase
MIIAIGGCSTSGKSALAAQLAEHFSDKKVKVFCQDDFTYPTPDIPKINGHTNWEIPESIDFEWMKNTIEKASKEYDLVIAEGLLIYHWPELNKMFDKKLFVEIDKKTFWERKHKDFRWGKEPDWYIEHIWNSYLIYGRPPKDKDLIVIDGTREFDIKEIARKINN